MSEPDPAHSDRLLNFKSGGGQARKIARLALSPSQTLALHRSIGRRPPGILRKRNRGIHSEASNYLRLVCQKPRLVELIRFGALRARYRESARAENESAARKFLKKRIGEVASGEQRDTASARGIWPRLVQSVSPACTGGSLYKPLPIDQKLRLWTISSPSTFQSPVRSVIRRASSYKAGRSEAASELPNSITLTHATSRR